MTAQIEDLWIRNLRPAPDAAVRLAGFPYAGGSASSCFTVSFVPGAGVFVAQYPGRRDRRTEPVGTDIGEPAGRIADDLAAFGVAHRLRAREAGPVSPVVSGRRAPYRDDAVHQRSGDGPVAELEDFGGTDAGSLRTVLPAVCGGHRAAETRRLADGTAPLDRPVLALVGDGGPRVDVGEVRGRGRHTSVGFGRDVLPGGRLSLVREQAASPLPVAG
ncbi:thioesterase II family protein [Streptomyces sp. NPDC003444]